MSFNAQTELNNEINSPSSAVEEEYALPANVYATFIMTYFKQDYSYYCGPATVKQTLTWFNGTADTQSNIATDIGGVTSSQGVLSAATMRSYINNRINMYSILNTSYVEVVNPSFDNFVWYMENYYGPPILRMAGTSSTWRYSTGGHYLNISGLYAYDCQLTDPYIQYVVPSMSSGKYYETYERIHAVTIAHHAKSFWW